MAEAAEAAVALGPEIPWAEMPINEIVLWTRKNHRTREVVVGPSAYGTMITLVTVDSKAFVRHWVYASERSVYDDKFFRLPKPKPISRDIKLRMTLLRLKWSTSGTDPEVFVMDGKGTLIPAWEFLPSKAEAPPDTLDNRYFWDGFQAEMACAPCTCLDSLGCYLRFGLAQMLKTARAKFPDATLATQSVLRVPKALRESASHEQVGLGCSPSLNVYGLQAERVSDPRSLVHRFAGGHIHWALKRGDSTPEFEANLDEAVKTLDATIGLIGVSMAANYDSPLRRRFFGLPGEHRRPVYPNGDRGLEYRVLSNFWMASPGLYHLIFTAARWFCQLGLAGSRGLLDLDEGEVVRVISETDVAGARRLLDSRREFFEGVYAMTWPRHAEFTHRATLGAMEDLGIHMRDAEYAWATLGLDERCPTLPGCFPQQWRTFCWLHSDGEKFIPNPGYANPPIKPASGVVGAEDE